MGVEGIILAAGLSSRANAFKLTLQFNGKTIIENAIDNMQKSCNRIIVVGGYKVDELKPILERYDNVELIYNEDYLQGMYSSVKKGMSCITVDRFFLSPGDYPLIMPEVFQTLLSYNSTIVIPTFEGRKGHPVLFKSAIIPQVLNQSKYETLRDAIKENESSLVPVACKGILMDLDTMEDYELLLRQIGGRGYVYEKGYKRASEKS